MTSDQGWDWFETAGPSPEDVAAAHQADTELAQAFATCFRGRHGERVLEHLRALTLDRVLGPENPDSVLRYLEGQRHLVAYICAFVARASRSPAVAGIPSRADTCQNEGEQL